MRDRLHQAGHPVFPVPLGSQLGCIDRKAGLLTAFLDKHQLDDGERPCMAQILGLSWLGRVAF